MGDRFTVRLNDENAEWVSEQSKDRDRSKAWVINKAIEQARGDDRTAPVRTGDNRTEQGPDYEALVERIGELEQRVDSTPSEKAPGGPREAPLESVDFPSGRDRPACEAATLAARDHIRENGGATMRDLVREVMPDHSLGYDVPDLESGDRFRGAWWRRVVKPGLEALPDVQAPARGASEWRHTGD